MNNKRGFFKQVDYTSVHLMNRHFSSSLKRLVNDGAR